MPPTETLQKVKVALGVDLQGLNVCSAFAALRRAESLRLEGLNGGRVLPAVGNAAGRPRLLSYNRQTTKQSAFSFFSLSLGIHGKRQITTSVHGRRAGNEEARFEP